jgi:hypothetical protein
MIVNENGSFQSQRQLPKMALIRVGLKSDHFLLESPESAETALQVPFNPPPAPLTPSDSQKVKRKCRYKCWP